MNLEAILEVYSKVTNSTLKDAEAIEGDAVWFLPMTIQVRNRHDDEAEYSRYCDCGGDCLSDHDLPIKSSSYYLIVDGKEVDNIADFEYAISNYNPERF